MNMPLVYPWLFDDETSLNLFQEADDCIQHIICFSKEEAIINLKNYDAIRPKKEAWINRTLS